MDKPSNFLNRPSRKTARPNESVYKTDRIKLKFELPNGRKAIIAGPTAEGIMALVPEWCPGAELIEQLD